MPTPIHHSRRARADLLDIWLEIAEHNLAAADRLYDRLEARMEILSRFAEAGTASPDIAKEARMLVQSSYPSCIAFARTTCRSYGFCMAREISTPPCLRRAWNRHLR